ncbi:hydantoinase B/oxoprolinase family protein [Rhodococcus erythropolis]
MTTIQTSISESSLRDLSETEFSERFGSSRFTCGVLANRLHYVAEHICTDLVTRAFSPIISFSYDFVGAVVGPPEQNFPLVGINKGNGAFLGSLSAGIGAAVTEYGLDRLAPGDLLVCNDPFRVGNHVNDMCFVRPVFNDGRILCFIVIRAHQLDIGGSVPGGFGLMKKDVYENGLVLAPMLMFSRDEPVRETLKIILDNTRFGETVLPDLHTIRSCCSLGETLVRESIDRYGTDALEGSMRYTIDSSADSMRRAISALPDGDFHGVDQLDSDGIDTEEYRLAVLVRKRGDRIEIDLSGSSRQARTSLNATALDAQTAVAIGLKMLLDPDTPFTSGVYRHIDVVIPQGCVTGARPPASTMFYFEVQGTLLNAIVRALAPALGSRAVAGSYGSTNLHTGSGRNPDGSPWFSAAELEAQFGGWGATDAGDADSHSGIFILNQRVTPSEEIEKRVPVLVTKKEYVTDTAGPGKHRGGSGLMKEALFLSDGDHIVVPLHFRSASGNGVYGGADGRIGGAWFFENSDPALPPTKYRIPDSTDFTGATVISGLVSESGELDPAGHFEFFGRRDVWHQNRGSTLRWITNGGGGWGNPFERDPNAVLRDVRDGYVSTAGALRDYGVVVEGDPENDPELLAIDIAGTEDARNAFRTEENK